MNPDLKKPDGLEPAGEKAYETIMAFLKAKKLTYTGGCKAFYSPAEWAQRKEDPIGPNGVLVVVHDGGDLAPVFNISYEQYALGDEISAKLKEHELWFESATCWYGVVFVTREWSIVDTTDHSLLGNDDGPFIYTDVMMGRAAATILNERFGGRARFRCIPHLKMDRRKKDEIKTEMSAEEAIIRIEGKAPDGKDPEH